MKTGIYFKNRKEWRKWLEKNSSSAEELWMIIYNPPRNLFYFRPSLEHVKYFLNIYS
jgi:hypothetical protein